MRVVDAPWDLPRARSSKGGGVSSQPAKVPHLNRDALGDAPWTPGVLIPLSQRKAEYANFVVVWIQCVPPTPFNPARALFASVCTSGNWKSSPDLHHEPRFTCFFRFHDLLTFVY